MSAADEDVLCRNIVKEIPPAQSAVGAAADDNRRTPVSSIWDAFTAR
jgi:hypothetical protein